MSEDLIVENHVCTYIAVIGVKESAYIIIYLVMCEL